MKGEVRRKLTLEDGEELSSNFFGVTYKLATLKGLFVMFQKHLAMDDRECEYYDVYYLLFRQESTWMIYLFFPTIGNKIYINT